MMPCLTLADDRSELDAQHIACSHLVRACRQAISDLALEDSGSPEPRRRAIEILKVVYNDWLEAQTAIVRELDATEPGSPASTRESLQRKVARHRPPKQYDPV